MPESSSAAVASAPPRKTIVEPDVPPVKLVGAAIISQTPSISPSLHIPTSSAHTSLPSSSPFTGFGAPPLVKQKRTGRFIALAMVFLLAALGYAYHRSDANFFKKLFPKSAQQAGIPEKIVNAPEPLTVSDTVQMPIEDHAPISGSNNLNQITLINMQSALSAATGGAAEYYQKHAQSYRDFCKTETVRSIAETLPAGATDFSCHEKSSGYLIHARLPHISSFEYCFDSADVYASLDHEPVGVTCQ